MPRLRSASRFSSHPASDKASCLVLLPSFLIEAFRQPAAATRYDQLFMRVGARRLGFGGCKLELRSKQGAESVALDVSDTSFGTLSVRNATLAYALLLHTHLLHTRYSCTSVHCKRKSCIRATRKAPMRIQWSASGFRKSYNA